MLAHAVGDKTNAITAQDRSLQGLLQALANFGPDLTCEQICAHVFGGLGDDFHIESRRAGNGRQGAKGSGCVIEPTKILIFFKGLVIGKLAEL